MSKLSLWKTIGLVGVFCAVEAIGSPAQTFTSLVSFNGTDGAFPGIGSLVQGLDGNLYGTVENGGSSDCSIYLGCGTVFKITPDGTLTTLYSFDGKDGFFPNSGLVLATDGNFYGTTSFGGDLSCDAPNGCGTVFKITPGGTLTTLHSFDFKDGFFPNSGLVLATDGNFYGTTDYGGAYSSAICFLASGCGTVFRITPGGTLTTLHSFDGTDGFVPSAGLVQATDGNFYGATYGGGASYPCPGGFPGGYCGTVFKITPAGTLTTLHRFDGTDGSGHAALLQATDGNFYGTTFGGGANDGGTVFKITPGGTLTTLYSFCSQTNCTDGTFPYAGLVQATDGNFYGTTTRGGANVGGTVFKITPGGTLTTLYSFCSQANCTDGGAPAAGLVQATDGNFYGTAGGGGDLSCDAPPGGCGTVFSLAVGLGLFVKTLPTSGEVGAAVIILGTDLTGATSVTFDGTAAAFTVVSSSEITTTVPSGAGTGEVQVTTPKGALISNVNFRVTPTISSFSPTSGPVGTSVVVTGEGFRGATSISIGGVMATSFTVDSDTQITATVPTGANTGHIAVSTLGGTAVSAGTFTIN
jgi:uncharacterized repeat protein (TIGR03803 family)